MQKVERVVGTGAMDGHHVSDAQLRGLVTQLAERADHAEILRAVELWRAEPTSAALSRLAAQTERVARSLGKHVDVSVATDGAYLAPGVFDSFWSTLVHVVRNAAYHGIEPSEERAEVGKPESGYVWLGARVRDDGRFEIEVKDDGRGIDVERLRKRAAERGLPVDEIGDAVDSVFAEGVSTAAEVNDVAGRGVGLSVVAEATARLGGNVHVATQAGKGTAFRFSSPTLVVGKAHG